MQVQLWNRQGDAPLLEYDPATADMVEVNRLVDELEVKHGARAFDKTTGEEVKEVTRQTQDVSLVRALAGG